MNDVRRGYWLIAAQAVCELCLLMPGARLWRVGPTTTTTAAVLIGGGAALGLGGARALGPGVPLHPIPPPGAALCSTGPYRLVRHPTYVGMLAAAVGWAVLRARPAPMAGCVAMAAVLTSKAVMEEEALLRRFGDDYLRYRARVAAGLPLGNGLVNRGQPRAAGPAKQP